MPTLVEQLQLEALDQNVSIAQLLRRVKLIAAKLKLEATTEWVDHELNGYRGATPAYRQVKGQPRAFNPYRGWIPITGSVEMMEAISSRSVGQSVAGLEALLKDRGGDGLYMPFSAKQARGLSGGGEPEFADMGLHIDQSVIVGMLDAVRSKVLDWAIGLEREGVLGSEVGFSEEEAKKAKDVVIQIHSFSGQLNTGDAVGPQSRINLGATDHSSNTSSGALFASLAEAAASVAEPGARREILGAVAHMQTEAGGPGFLAAYRRFMEAAADHVTVFTPMLPALAQMLT